jgi:hypothetical protein
MRKLIFVFALLCCSTEAIAADHCTSLPGKCMAILANGFNGVISQIDYNGAYFFLQAKIQFTGYAPDSLTGYCVGDHLIFTRVHAGQGAFTQFYSGSFSDPSTLSGTYVNGSQTAKHLNWNAKVGACPLPPPPPSKEHIACVAVCDSNQQECSPPPCGGTAYNKCVNACPP